MPSSAFGPTTTSPTTDRLVELMQQLAGSIGVCDTGGQVRLGMALEEAFRLAILRGNLEMTPERAAGHAAGTTTRRSELARAARRRPRRYAGRKLRVHVQIAPEEARFVIAHEGPPLRLPSRRDRGERPAWKTRATAA